MKRKNVIVVGIFSLIIFMIIASYLWYVHFTKYEEVKLAQNEKTEFIKAVELINSGATTYLDAANDDVEEIIPIYYFRVKNSSNKDFNYIVYFQNAESDDGCTKETTFNRNELEYELKLDNKVIKSGGLETISNNELDINTVVGNSVNDYSLKVRIKPDVTDYANKHFHYTVTMKENK